ncbi:NIPSNAP family protein [Microlunatus parietis]|uniref:Quinol monooxygenase YgiN n=1 Tax=Microlunatus parietis TaxID=682979 RepID=A0A7Y9LGW1_9ACTN|nr:NIPSNAP family protein [Microlunatus parietis]NYE75646.1 quinol monooxygenase YgiN [Microlunatus parietis]
MEPSECGVVELRRYLLRPGRRDELIELFEREFVESQQELGICLLGLFREEGDEDRFVWFRGYRDLEARIAALQGFYEGPVWARHARAANATMIDSDDVLLLEPIKVYESADDHGASRPSVEVAISEAGRLPEDPPGFRPLAVFKTLHAENGYPGLPVREADVVVTVGTGAPAPGAPNAVRLRLQPTRRSHWP